MTKKKPINKTFDKGEEYYSKGFGYFESKSWLSLTPRQRKLRIFIYVFIAFLFGSLEIIIDFVRGDITFDPEMRELQINTFLFIAGVIFATISIVEPKLIGWLLGGRKIERRTAVLLMIVLLGYLGYRVVQSFIS